MPKPLLIYDGDCNFCKRWIARWKNITGDLVDYAPSEAPIAAVQLREPDGKMIEGAHAVFKSLSYEKGAGFGLWLYNHLPGFPQGSEFLYALVARNRKLFSKLTNLFWGTNLEPPTYVASSWIFMRLLGFINLIAFLSLFPQIEGLAGPQGIAPSAAPVLLYCKSGIALSALLILDLAPWFVLLILWGLYISLFTAGREFMSFQWDVLLLEINFLAMFLNPPRLPPRLINRSGPSTVAIWIFHLILFKLMLQSGLVKLLSGDAAWRNLTALTFHYETQPIPNALSWHAHHLPLMIHKISCLGMFAIELFVPLLIFFPRRLKLAAFIAFASLQLLIMATGNYGFFNWLTIALCLLLLDDQTMGEILPKILLDRLSNSARTFISGDLPRWWDNARKIIFIPIAAALILFNVTFIAGTFYSRNYPAWMIRILKPAYENHLSGSYGLFAVMTTSRPEIVIEGSDDGKTWREYEFKWKAGDLSRRPPFVAPHQPRLDWQMWFASLGDVRQNQWFINLLIRLLQGSEPVLKLMEKNPFPKKPPLAVRARLYQYHFTTPEERKATGQWWKREFAGMYCPAISMKE